MNLKKKILKGIGASPGIVIGKAFLIDNRLPSVPRYNILPYHIEDEIKRFEIAIKKSKEQFQKAKELYLKKGDKEHLVLFDAYLLMLEDKDLIKEVEELIKQEKINAEWAVFKETERLKKLFESVEEEYLKDKLADIKYISSSIINNLLGEGRELSEFIESEGPIIVVAHELSPADIVNLTKTEAIGFITEAGSQISHTAILARSIELPGVVGVSNAVESIYTGDELIVDGEEGIIIINPDSRDIERYEIIIKEREKLESKFYLFRNYPAITKDGVKVSVKSNLELPEEVDLALSYGAEGVGLYRTEFLYINRQDLPSEEEQFEVYANVAKKFSPLPVYLRTFDLGGDKFIDTFKYPKQLNPALGLRAIRLALKEPSIFITQVKAMLRASIYGNVKIMLPFIGGVSELEDILELIEEAKNEIRKKNEKFKEDIEIGCMIELPSAVIVADLLAEKVDFFSIGTNDLIQYSLGIDRTNEHVAYLYHPLHISVLRQIKHVVDVGREKNIPVFICGAMADDPLYIPVLLGLGLTSLSMSYATIPESKYIIRNITMERSKEIVETILKMRSYKEIEEYVYKEMNKMFPNIFKKSPYE